MVTLKKRVGSLMYSLHSSQWVFLCLVLDGCLVFVWGVFVSRVLATEGFLGLMGVSSV